MYTGVFTLKTQLDTLSWLCILESKLLSIRAFSRLNLHQDRDESTELTLIEESVINAGNAYGCFLYAHQRDALPPLSERSRALLCSINGLGQEIHQYFWDQAVQEGIDDACCDRALAALESA
jgi:hypothetical protein